MAQTTPARVPALSKTLTPEALSEGQRAAAVRALDELMERLPRPIGPLRLFLLIGLCCLLPPAVLPVGAWVLARERRRSKVLRVEGAAELRALGLGDALVHQFVEAAVAARGSDAAPEEIARDGLRAAARALDETDPALLDELRALGARPRVERALRLTSGLGGRGLELLASLGVVFVPGFVFDALTVSAFAFVPVTVALAIATERLPGWLLPRAHRRLARALRPLHARFGSLEAARQLAPGRKKAERS